MANVGGPDIKQQFFFPVSILPFKSKQITPKCTAVSLIRYSPVNPVQQENRQLQLHAFKTLDLHLKCQESLLLSTYIYLIDQHGIVCADQIGPYLTL